MNCGQRYYGTSFPDDHGTECVLPEGHDRHEPGSAAAKHTGVGATSGKTVRWYSTSQKVERERLKRQR